MLWAADPEGGFSFVNRRWLEFTGGTPERELGRGWREALHPDDVADVDESFRRGCKAAGGFAVDFRLRRADGIYRWIRADVLPRFDEQGQFGGLVGACFDITERRLREEASGTHDRLLEAVAQATNVLLTSRQADDGARDMLRILGEAMGVDRAFVFENRVQSQLGVPALTHRHEWTSLRAVPRVHDATLQNVPYDPDLTRLFKLFMAGRHLAAHARDLSESERRALRLEGHESVLFFPVPVRGRTWGVIGFEVIHSDRNWSSGDLSLLTAMAGSLGVALARQQSDAMVGARDRLLRGVADASHELLSHATLDEAMQNALRLLGEAACVDRTYLFENFVNPATGEHMMRARYIWQLSPRTPLDMAALQSLSYNVLFPRWYETLQAGKPISGRVLDFIGTATSQTLTGLLRSILLVPIMTRSRFRGFVGFDDGNLERHWLPGDESILQAVAESIGAAMAREQDQDALRKNEELFRTLVENASDIIAIIGESGTIGYVSPSIQRILGYPPEDLIGNQLLDYLHPGDVAGCLEAYWVVRNYVDINRSAEFRLRHKDGDWHFFEGVGKSVLEDGVTRSFVVSARDITERRRATEALRRSEEMLRHSQKMEAVGRLAGGVAHDFNNLLTAIMGYSELALQRLEPADPTHRDIDEIAKAADRAHTLTRQLLAFSRKQVLEPRLVNLAAVVSDLQRLLRRLIGEDIVVQTELDPSTGFVRVDVGQIEQAVVNLAVNARDAMPNGGTLVVRTANADLAERLVEGPVTIEPGPYVTLSVSDTGHGMDDYVKAHLFEPFFTTKEVGRGTGLGLPMVYGVISQSGGRILLRSTVGQGTTFTIYLPREPAGPEEVAPPPLPATRGGSEFVLLVEDEDSVRELTQRVLEEHGYTVLAARHGLDALRLADDVRGSVDLILTDVVMPYFNGRELVTRLRQRFPSARVLYMSGYAQDTSHDLDKLDGQFIQKPFTPSALSRKIREVMEKA